MNVLILVGLVVAAIMGLAAVAVVAWLILRPGSSPTSRRGRVETTTETGAGPAESTVEAQFEVREAEEGPRQRPRELDRESRRELLLLDERLHREFFDQSEKSPQEWARISDDLLIVHDQMPVGILVERFEQATGAKVNAPAQTEKSAREVAALLNEQLSNDRRLELIGTLEESIEADVYGPTGH